MKGTIIFCLLFVLYHVQSQSTCNSPFVSLANECYYVSPIIEKADWVTAREKCLKLGGLLASLDTEEKNQAVGDYLGQNTDLGNELRWIALNDQAQEGRYVWDGTGAKATYTSFTTVSKSNAKNCIVDGDGTNYAWTDYTCDQELPFICQQLPSCSITPGECDPPFTAVGNGCYNFYSENGATWMNAHNYCNTWGSSLVSIDSAEEDKAINDYLTEALPDNTFWIGGYDGGHEGDWFWDNSGYPMNYTNWESGQPSGGTAENCALTYGDSWSDYPCDDSYYFICEMPTRCFNS